MTGAFMRPHRFGQWADAGFGGGCAALTAANGVTTEEERRERRRIRSMQKIQRIHTERNGYRSKHETGREREGSAQERMKRGSSACRM